jgi:hypothetical protein
VSLHEQFDLTNAVEVHDERARVAGHRGGEVEAQRVGGEVRDESAAAAIDSLQPAGGEQPDGPTPDEGGDQRQARRDFTQLHTLVYVHDVRVWNGCMKPPKVLLGREERVEAAIDELAERGFQGLSVEPLSRRLGISKGSF